MLQHFFFLQPVIAVLGLAETGLPWLWQREGDRRSGYTGPSSLIAGDGPRLGLIPVVMCLRNGYGARAEGQR
jgi:hypothetical protein